MKHQHDKLQMKHQDDKNRIDDLEDVKAKNDPIVNSVKKPNEAPPTLNDDNNPSENWHLESGEKLNEYGK